MLVDKYSPKSIREVLDQKDLILNTNTWLDSWKPGDKALLVYGPIGTGKSSIVKLVAKEKGMKIFELNTGESRSASAIREKLLPASKEKSLVGKRVIIIDDVDSLSGSDRGGIAEIISVMKDSLNPIILIAGDAYNPKLKTLRTYCELLKTRRVPVNTIEKRLHEISAKEGLKINSDSIRKISENAHGDVRSAINDLETLNENSSRDKQTSIFEVMNSIFRTGNIRKAAQAIDSADKDIDEIFWWVEQNIPLEYQNKEQIAQAFEALSKADTFNSMIRRNQNYRFKKYMRDMISSISLIENKQRKFIMYRPPGRLMTLGSTKVSRKEAEEFYKSLGINASSKKIKEHAPYLKMILGRKFKG